MDFTATDRKMSSLNLRAQKAFNLFLTECKKNGLNVLVTETKRSQERQNYLYCQGRTISQVVAKGISKEFATKYCNPNANKVTWTLKSNHSSGMAIDICKNVKGQEYSDATFFKQCGEIAAELGITWGGIWKSSPDTPHFEIGIDWKEPPKKVVKEDVELSTSVSNIIKNGIQLTYNSWKRLDLINLNNVPALVCKLAKIKINGTVSIEQYKQAIDKLVKDGIITQRFIWDNKRYTVNNVRSLLIKYASKL